jgi:hypothetical protein
VNGIEQHVTEFVTLQEIVEYEPSEAAIAKTRMLVECAAALSVLESRQAAELDKLLSRHRQERNALLPEVHFRLRQSASVAG